ncbi:3-hydroxybutyrate oligomer hydrolase family protein [Granulosicoccus antarcticus]|uniref:D-(-)-3-hydroxybutyrate oligomer hydrolase n=1 Tax=Granulosicoccus antarcticus IMCC3135 TaxID=1192854 RepID=A0A2Z2NP60_9GAMM|nr:3-hydroxybutyrate oligomer hydrolase family protein [Granulosicoccus antarcticus]ASJ73043.1 D-(-)-3-hydroxybutyrate oligomer hydrolase [Granulosicoccus antarcticus IMCC3135]
MKHGLNKRPSFKQYYTVTAVVTIAALLSSCSDDDENTTQPSGQVAAIDTLGPVLDTRHDGENDGLLGGLGLSGLRTPPVFYADPAAPTAAELRRATLHANYAALVDLRAEGGFGTLYGPTDDTSYPGREFRAFVGEGINRATLMLQLPDSFDPDAACLVVAPSSGSRNAYGAVGTSGDWGVSKGCAVAYTDANKGTGAVELTQKTGFDLSLESIELASSSDEASFVVPTSENVPTPGADYAGITLPGNDEVQAYADANPNRYAFKHAHSQKNIEKDWGLHTLESIQFALNILSEEYETSLTTANTLIMGASVSNGGSAILRAAEASDGSVFDGIVVGEPNVNPVAAASPFTINMAGRDPFDAHSAPFYDYIVAAELYAACASKASVNTGATFAELRGDTTARCNSLVAAGLLDEGDIELVGEQANQKLLEAGYLSESTKLLAGYAGVDLFQSLITTYGNAYTRSSVVDALCSVSMAHVITATLTPAPYPLLTTLAADSNGIPRTAGMFLIKDDSPAGATIQIAAPSSNGELDYNLEGALCWKDLRDNAENPLNARLVQGIDEIKASGDLHGVPTIIVHGRADALIPVNHSSRPYYVLNQQVEGENSALKYYEVPHAQHLDSLLGAYAASGMNFLPIDYYFKQSLDLMYAHLMEGTDLPASQVLATSAPVDGVVTQENLGSIAANVTASQAITYEDGALLIPQ